MLWNYLKVALRNLRRDKLYTFVNVVGLSVGVAACLLIMLFIRHEWSYDAFHEKADRTYRAWGRENWGDGREFFYSITPIPLGDALKQNLPAVEETVRIYAFNAIAGPEGRRFSEQLRMVDTSFFDVFDFELREGGYLSSAPNSVVLTAETAHKYFGSDNSPIGRALPIRIDDEPQDYIVTGVVERVPQASSIQFDLLIPFTEAPDLIDEIALTSWFNIFVETYVVLAPGVEAAVIEAKLPSMIDQILGEEAGQAGYELGLQPLTDIHLDVDVPVGIEAISNPVYSYLLAGIALLLLVVASINFVTLSIGQSARRMSEVGIRKAAGAGRSHLMAQFWGESILTTLLAVVVGFGFAWATLPLFRGLTLTELTFVTDAGVVLFLVVLTATLALAAGVYPAFILSGFHPADVLRGQVFLSGDRSLIRRGLVVLQFSISILLIVATLFVWRQLDYLQEKEIGFDKDQVVVLRTEASAVQAPILAARLKGALGGSVQSLAYSAFAMDDPWATFSFEADGGTYEAFMVNLVSPEFLNVMDIELVAGRGFSRDRPGDSTALVVNEAFVREFGFESASASVGGQIPSRSFETHEIIGVVKDFNFESLHAPIKPLALAQTPSWLFRGASDVSIGSSMRADIALRIPPGSVADLIGRIEESWARVVPDTPFDFYFLDEALDARYRQEERLSKIVVIGSGLSILIACLGLFSLAALTVVRRTKEIGLRKVLGASSSSIVILLTRDFSVLVGIAFLISAPVAFVLVRQWLDNFAYRVDLSPLTFLVAGLMALIVAVLTVSYQTMRAALTDPVASLRRE